ncbi:hypothetical protein PVAP13_7KG122691 [Panicum virgatum]|uniref:Uncharacterized protein n=1 Tax=Panicum virgatum TaxID=38727 RepID=A0A8T0QD50_PANVG|nr:hypothetical protein PVAP13_7KG122691 [Panicum virgatum]
MASPARVERLLGINLCSFYPVSVSIRFCFSVSLWGSAFRVIWIRAASCNGQRRASSRRGVRVRVARHDPACGMAHASYGSWRACRRADRVLPLPFLCSLYCL